MKVGANGKGGHWDVEFTDRGPVVEWLENVFQKIPSEDLRGPARPPGLNATSDTSMVDRSVCITEENRDSEPTKQPHLCSEILDTKCTREHRRDHR